MITQYSVLHNEFMGGAAYIKGNVYQIFIIHWIVLLLQTGYNLFANQLFLQI